MLLKILYRTRRNSLAKEQRKIFPRTGAVRPWGPGVVYRYAYDVVHTCVRAATPVARRRCPSVFPSLPRSAPFARTAASVTSKRSYFFPPAAALSVPPARRCIRECTFAAVVNALAAADVNSRCQTPPLPRSIFRVARLI